jgi:hypothetical protein
VSGRVSAILELGTGFTPHNTGRENIAMGCLVLGMSPAEIARKTPEIIAFSELGEVIDRPFHTYSSGMQARLTFSVAISPEPDVLIIDEALAVGDARFQQKCFARIRAMRRAGTSILLVSHDDNTITTFCDRAVIIDKGRLVAMGPVEQMAPLYHRLLFGTDRQTVLEPVGNDPPASRPGAAAGPTAERAEPLIAPAAEAPPCAPRPPPAIHPETAHAFRAGCRQLPELDEAGRTAARNIFGNGRAELDTFGIMDTSGNRIERITSGDRCCFYLRLRARSALSGYTLGFAIRDRRATVVWGITNVTQKIELPPLAPGESIDCVCDVRIWLAESEYSLVLGAADQPSGDKIAFIDNGIPLKVAGPGRIFTTSVVNLEQRFEVGLPSAEMDLPLDRVAPPAANPGLAYGASHGS